MKSIVSRVFMIAGITLLGTNFAPTAINAQTAYGSCPQRAQYYQQRYESSLQSSDLVCFQAALEREMSNSASFSCPRTSQEYQTAYEKNLMSNDLVCFQKALERELR